VLDAPAAISPMATGPVPRPQQLGPERLRVQQWCGRPPRPALSRRPAAARAWILARSRHWDLTGRGVFFEQTNDARRGAGKQAATLSGVELGPARWTKGARVVWSTGRRSEGRSTKGRRSRSFLLFVADDTNRCLIFAMAESVNSIEQQG
jgi:hypothetical protein